MKTMKRTMSFLLTIAFFLTGISWNPQIANAEEGTYGVDFVKNTITIATPYAGGLYSTFNFELTREDLEESPAPTKEQLSGYTTPVKVKVK